MVSKELGRLYKGLKDYAGTVANTSVVLITGGVEQLTSAAIYRCPCVELSQRVRTAIELRLWNFFYFCTCFCAFYF